MTKKPPPQTEVVEEVRSSLPFLSTAPPRNYDHATEGYAICAKLKDDPKVQAALKAGNDVYIGPNMRLPRADEDPENNAYIIEPSRPRRRARTRSSM